ncbi:hypothetical protein ACIRBX_25085 [Kitasatospora sp. NPDC096147]|uniref:hypothetical protein n=1 Tax=Kitasatospora sp. NPDC096147 TaxID=3364093 RepID=UPI0038275FB4
MTRNEPRPTAPLPPLFIARPTVPRAVPANAAITTSQTATPIYDQLVAEYGDPHSRLGPTRARLRHLGETGS